MRWGSRSRPPIATSRMPSADRHGVPSRLLMEQVSRCTVGESSIASRACTSSACPFSTPCRRDSCLASGGMQNTWSTTSHREAAETCPLLDRRRGRQLCGPLVPVRAFALVSPWRSVLAVSASADLSLIRRQRRAASGSPSTSVTPPASDSQVCRRSPVRPTPFVLRVSDLGLVQSVRRTTEPSGRWVVSLAGSDTGLKRLNPHSASVKGTVQHHVRPRPGRPNSPGG